MLGIGLEFYAWSQTLFRCEVAWEEPLTWRDLVWWQPLSLVRAAFVGGPPLVAEVAGWMGSAVP